MGGGGCHDLRGTQSDKGWWAGPTISRLGHTGGPDAVAAGLVAVWHRAEETTPAQGDRCGMIKQRR